MGANDRFQTVTLVVLERPGPGKVFARLMGRKSYRSVQLLLGCSPHWRMHRVQSLPQDTPAVPAFRILSFCPLPSVLRALTGCNCIAGEAHSTPRICAQDPNIPSSDFHSFTQQDKQPRAPPNQLQWETPLPAKLHCCCNELQLTWSTYSKDGTKTQAPGNTCCSWSCTENKTSTGELEILLFTSMS